MLFGTWAPSAGKVALINVPYGHDGPPMLPLGIASVAAYARASGIEVTAYEFGPSICSPRTIISRHPDLTRFVIYGLSFYNSNARLAFEFAEAIREANPRAFIVAGGPHASACPVEIIEDCPAFDAAVVGEGEQLFLELINSIYMGAERINIDGIVFRGDHLGKSTIPGKVSDLNLLPPPISDFVFDGVPVFPTFFDQLERRRRRAVGLVTSRSCPYNCSFCAIILIGRDWRHASATKVRHDFEYLDSQAGPYEHVYFMDANFFVRPKRSIEIAEQLRKTTRQPTFSFSTRVNQIICAKDELKELKSLGLRAVEMGVESASGAALKRFSKGIRPEQNDEALEILRELGIPVILDFIMFDSEATPQDIHINLDFMERNSLDTYVPWDHLRSYLTPYLGTPIRNHYEKTLGFNFNLHEVPNGSELLSELSVGAVYEEFERLFRVYPDLPQAVIQYERRASDLPWGIERARMTLNAFSLRRLPFVVLRNLTNMAEEGRAPCLEHALPVFRRDDGTAIQLLEVMDYGLATT